VTAGGGQGGDPFELDPFGGGEYNPSFAFAFQAEEKAREHLEHARRFVQHEMVAHVDRTNQLARSARKSSAIRLADLEDLYYEIEESKALALKHDSESPEFRAAIDNAMERFGEFKGGYDTLITVAAKMATADPQLGSTMPVPIDPATLVDPHAASLQVHSDLAGWLASVDHTDGKLAVIKATPGVGKTHAMIRSAYSAQQAKLRTVFAARTKEMIAGPEPELKHRLSRMHPTGKIGLSVLHGRDETNCAKHETVEAVMAHGYAPGRTVCFQCEYYPDNSRIFGLGICEYYQERINAFNVARAVRRGWAFTYNIILTTHASYIAANLVEGGRWGAFWVADIAFFDEDPTDAMEVDIILGRSQCGFTSRSPGTQGAGAFAELCSTAIDLAKLDRKRAEDDKFRADDQAELNTHPIHSRYDSKYTGEDLHYLLEDARRRMRGRVASLGQLLRDVASGGGFHVQVGGLAAVSSTDDINQMDVPPKSLQRVADSVLEEMGHALAFRRQLYYDLYDRYPEADTLEGIVAELQQHTDITPLSYVTRLECLPRDPEKGRDEDEWRFVLRDHRPLANTQTTLVVGDAYAQQAHYEYLFQRPAQMIEVTASLHPDAEMLRVVDSSCNISEMERGGTQRVLGFVESHLSQFVKPGDRVLIYGHDKLRPIVEPWLEKRAEQYQLDEVAYEHWWGGRGKDGYNGWEFTYCISDPVLSLSGIQHVANARAFRDAVRAKTPEEKRLHSQRCEIAVSKQGTTHALRNSHPRIALEHDRMNVAEGTQALHRSRVAHNPVRTVTFGEVEQSPDLVAQVSTIVLADSRKAKVSRSRRKKTRQITATVDSFVSDDEAFATIMAIVRHFGFYSPWLAHALVTVPIEVSGPSLFSDLAGALGPHGVGRPSPSGARGVPVQKSPEQGVALVQTRVASVVYRGSSIDDGGNSPQILDTAPGWHDLAPSNEGGGNRVPGESKPLGSAGPGGPTEPAGGPTEPAQLIRLEPDLRSVIERVWHPPAYWRLMNEYRSLPKAVREAHLLLPKRLPGKRAARWPTWAEGLMAGGRRPMIYWSDDVLRFDAAIREFYRVFDNQYGPLIGNKLKRPNAVMEVPASISEIPF
jgi:hypothetical protein